MIMKGDCAPHHIITTCPPVAFLRRNSHTISYCTKSYHWYVPPGGTISVAHSGDQRSRGTGPEAYMRRGDQMSKGTGPEAYIYNVGIRRQEKLGLRYIHI